ncbi:MAG: hypothetical protein GY765_08210 [bacterium]|nr:hypothetical protein [bacterium]
MVKDFICHTVFLGKDLNLNALLFHGRASPWPPEAKIRTTQPKQAYRNFPAEMRSNYSGSHILAQNLFFCNDFSLLLVIVILAARVFTPLLFSCIIKSGLILLEWII